MKNAAEHNETIFKEWKFTGIIVLMLAGLVFSKWLLSVSQMILFLAIVTDKGGISRIIKAFKNPLVLLLISVFVLHLTGLLWTEDLTFGLRDLKNKIQLLTFPVLFASIPIQSRSKSLIILKSFIVLMGIMSVINLIRHFIVPHTENYQPALWHSHIRFSLMLCLSIFIIVWLFIQKTIHKKETIPATIVLLIFLVSLVFLESFTGLVVFALLLPFMYILFYRFIKSNVLKISFLTVLIAFTGLSVYTVYSVKNTFFPKPGKEQIQNLEKKSPSGNLYLHDTTITLNENGNLVYIYINFKELEQEWNKRSKKSLYENDEWRGNILIRYLSSKGLRKDSSGVWQLSNEDITNIENRIPNYRLAGIDPIRKRLYMFFWELNVYKNTHDPSGHSLTQRMEYWKAARMIIAENFWTGVGTGDIKNAFNNMYDKMGSHLNEKYRLRAHNQYLTFWITFGIFGFLLFIFSLLFPVFSKPHRYNLLYIGYIFIFLLSMLNEDTLETQVGMSFYVLFNSLFLFVIDPKDFWGRKNDKMYKNVSFKEN